MGVEYTSGMGIQSSVGEGSLGHDAHGSPRPHPDIVGFRQHQLEQLLHHSCQRLLLAATETVLVNLVPQLLHVDEPGWLVVVSVGGGVDGDGRRTLV